VPDRCRKHLVPGMPKTGVRVVLVVQQEVVGVLLVLREGGFQGQVVSAVRNQLQTDPVERDS